MGRGDSSRNAPWSDREKITLLLQIIHDSGIEPQWKQFKVPPGRTLNAARLEYASMTSQFLREQQDSSDEDESSNAESSPQPHIGKGEDDVEGSASSNASDNGTSNSVTVAEGWVPNKGSKTNAQGSGSSSAPFGLKRKRGRPTKQESEARKAAIARGELPPPKTPSYVPVNTPVYSLGPDGVPKRRRGRPSKREIQERKAAEAIGGTPKK